MATYPKGHDISCLFSVVINNSGQRRFFGFLPPHGRTLNPGEEFTLFGDIREALGSDISRVGNTRARISFENAIIRGDIAIVQTPSPILENVNGTSKMLKLNVAGAFVAAKPCWQTSYSESFQDQAP